MLSADVVEQQHSFRFFARPGPNFVGRDETGSGQHHHVEDQADLIGPVPMFARNNAQCPPGRTSFDSFPAGYRKPGSPPRRRVRIGFDEACQVPDAEDRTTSRAATTAVHAGSLNKRKGSGTHRVQVSNAFWTASRIPIGRTAKTPKAVLSWTTVGFRSPSIRCLPTSKLAGVTNASQRLDR